MTSIASRARERGVTEILHFTTNLGLVGILAGGEVLSHSRLKASQHLSAIATFNAPNRDMDPAWVDHISMSVSRINGRYFGSSVQWHPDVWWAVLAFHPEILNASGVTFTNTNNGYGDGVGRGTGLEHFEAMFADSFPRALYPTSSVRRAAGLPAHLTTDVQAELLYPEQLDLTWLKAIYVADPAREDEIAAYRAAFDGTAGYDLSSVEIACRPDMFA